MIHKTTYIRPPGMYVVNRKKGDFAGDIRAFWEFKARPSVYIQPSGSITVGRRV